MWWPQRSCCGRKAWSVRLSSKELKEFLKIAKTLGGSNVPVRLSSGKVTAVGDAGTVTTHISVAEEGDIDVVVSLDMLKNVPIKEEAVSFEKDGTRLAIASGSTTVRLATQDPSAVTHLDGDAIEKMEHREVLGAALRTVLRRVRPFVGGTSVPTHLQAVLLSGATGKVCTADGMSFAMANLDGLAGPDILLPPEVCEAASAFFGIAGAEDWPNVHVKTDGNVCYMTFCTHYVRAPMSAGKFPGLQHFSAMKVTGTASVVYDDFSESVQELAHIFGKGTTPVAVNFERGAMSINTAEADVALDFGVTTAGNTIEGKRLTMNFLCRLAEHAFSKDFVMEDLGPAYPLKFSGDGLELYVMPLR